jgi:hypothetical protein
MNIDYLLLRKQQNYLLTLDDSHDQEMIQGIVNLFDCMITYDKKYPIKVAVACHDSNGSPDLFFCQIHATFNEIEDGKHLQAAKNAASNLDYQGPFVVIDENDKLFEKLKFFAPEYWVNQVFYDLEGKIIEQDTHAFNSL